MPRRRKASTDEPGATQRVQRRDVNAAARVVTALDLAIAGHDWETIAHQSGFGNRGTAYKAVQRELERRIDERVDALRALQLARLGRLRTVYYPKAMAGDGWSMDRVLRLDERESALMGLDATRDAAPTAPTIIEIASPLTQALRGQAEQAAIVQALERGEGAERDDRE